MKCGKLLILQSFRPLFVNQRSPWPCLTAMATFGSWIKALKTFWKNTPRKNWSRFRILLGSALFYFPTLWPVPRTYCLSLLFSCSIIGPISLTTMYCCTHPQGDMIFFSARLEGLQKRENLISCVICYCLFFLNTTAGCTTDKYLKE